MAELDAEVSAAQEALDREVVTALKDCRNRGLTLYCRRGCANCCRLAVHATWPEAERLAAQLTDAQRATLAEHVAQLRPLAADCADFKTYLRRYRTEMNGCPFLDTDGACGVYAFRPLSCRALLSTRPGDWCGIDLATLPDLDKQLYLASLDPELVDYPTHYLSRTRSRGEVLENRLLEQMRQTDKVAVSGNLAMLCWLAGEGRPPAALNCGGMGLAKYLQEQALPDWLVRISPG